MTTPYMWSSDKERCRIYGNQLQEMARDILSAHDVPPEMQEAAHNITLAANQLLYLHSWAKSRQLSPGEVQNEALEGRKHE